MFQFHRCEGLQKKSSHGSFCPYSELNLQAYPTAAPPLTSDMVWWLLCFTPTGRPFAQLEFPWKMGLAVRGCGRVPSTSRTVPRPLLIGLTDMAIFINGMESC